MEGISRLSRRAVCLCVASVAISGISLEAAHGRSMQKTVVMKSYGSFFAGGKTVTANNGQTIYGEHLYAQYTIPKDPRKFNLVMWHGGGQTGKTWDTTPDGRDGYQQIFNKRGFATYVIDQPWSGKAGATTVGTTIDTGGSAGQMLFEAFRLGTWPVGGKPEYYPGVKFPRDKESLDQFIRWASPPTGPDMLDQTGLEYGVPAMGELLKKIGPSVLFTHSASGGPGFLTALKNPGLVRGIAAYEVGRFFFPKGEVPPDTALAIEVPLAEFKNLTLIPIQIVFGDNIETSEFVKSNLDGAKKFVAAVNKHGGRASLVILPEIGIKGNTHFPFSDTNNDKIADICSIWMKKYGLDR